MPYIKEELRTAFEPAIQELAQLLTDSGRLPPASGELNYIFCALLDRVCGTNYEGRAEAIKALECAKLELYRKVLAPYEDGKAQANGEVFKRLGAP